MRALVLDRAPRSETFQQQSFLALASFHSHQGAGFIFVLLLVIIYTAVRQLLACAATALVLLPVYTLKLKGSGINSKASSKVRPTRAAALTKRELIANVAALRACDTPLLLPPQPPSSAGRLTVVLDVDHTLVAAAPVSSAPPALLAAASRGHAFEVGVGRERVLVLPRPGLQQFLDALSGFAEVVVFTAGVPAYAEPLVAAIDPGRRRISACLYRDATLTTASKDHIKDLSRLGRNLQRCVLVDNNPYSFLLQPLNGLPVVPFTGDLGDRQLLSVILPLLQGLAALPDVRPLLGLKFGMPEWFKGRGYDVGCFLPELTAWALPAAACKR